MVKIDINVSGRQASRHSPGVHTARNTKFLSSEAILRYILGNDEQIETLILCKPEDVELMTTDYNLYEALGSVKPYDNININKVTKLLEVVELISYRQKTNTNKPILKDERVEELRRSSLSKKQDHNHNIDQHNDRGV
ncbi:hypothetical protein HY497_02060 [Candidatus Woesearchaeota archaeon]|nr:hypothetical protein [Candidatus Woesearchaeota archaeon]